jgi:ABC-type branched-subunit amino acid transport system ATPase component
MSAAATEAAVSARGVCKRYGVREAVRDVELEIARGEIFALLGPNGAGKTTLVEILAGLRSRSAGDVRVLGADPAYRRRRLARADRRRAAGVAAGSRPHGSRVPAELFPVERLADGLRQAFEATVAVGDLLVLAAWAAAGLAVGVRRFSWTPTAAA